MTKNYVSIHNHTDHSMLDGLGTIERYVAKASRKGMPGLGIMDHGNLMGAPLFYSECLKNGINPLIFQEFYFVPNADRVKEEKQGERFHVGIGARDADGFRILCELSTEAYKRFYYKPVIDRPLLESLGDAAEHLTVLTGCAAGILSRKLLKEAVDDHLSVEEEIAWWRHTFPHLYVEIMNHETSFDRKLNRRLLKLSERQGLPFVITNDPHFVDKNEADHHDALLAIQTASDIDDPNRFRFDGQGYWLKTRAEMKRAFREYGKEVWKPGLDATLEICRDTNIRIPEWDTRSWHIPKFPLVNNSVRLLKKLAWDRLAELGLDEDKRYVKRTKMELKRLTAVGMEDFLLITWDAIGYARRTTKRHREIAKILGHPKEPLPVGPGRGSVCGTLVGYLLGIHKMDPIRYDLMFERFLNPERPKAPDVDTDYSQARRGEMIDYYIHVYGAENVIPVGAYQTMQTKRCFQSLARAYGIHDPNERNKLSKEIQEDDEGNAVMPLVIRENFPELVEAVEVLTGVKASMSTHAAGLLMYDPADPIRHYIPRMFIPKRQDSPAKWVCQYNLASAELLDLFKQDNLGLRTLDTIDECVRIVRERHGDVLDPYEWVPDEEPHDKNVYSMLTKGDCEGIFQMEGFTNFLGIQQIKPTQFMDIVTCTALYRKGPMEAGAPDRFLKNRKDQKIRVAHPDLKKYLKPTWGEMIFQEQMFAILNELAGLSWAQVDDVKSAVTKKDPEKMAKLRSVVIEGFRKTSGWDQSKAEEVWDMIEKQTGYLFNKSHSVAYTFTTYITARLKYLYPLEFYTALLRTVKPTSPEAKAKRLSYLNSSARKGFEICPPDVNLSDALFSCQGKNKLLFGLRDVLDIGEKAAEKIVRGRPRKGYQSVKAVMDAVNHKTVMRALSESGAMECLGVKATNEQKESRIEWQFNDPMREFREKYGHKAKLPRTNNGQVRIYGQIVKVEKKSTKSGKPYMTWKIKYEPGVEFAITLWEDAMDLWDLKVGSIVRVSGRWNGTFRNVSVGDSDMVRVYRRAK